MEDEVYYQDGPNCISYAIKNAAERLWPDKVFEWEFIKDNLGSLYELEKGLKIWNRKGIPEKGEKNILEHRIGAFFEITTLKSLKNYLKEFKNQPFLISYTRRKVTDNGVHRPDTKALGGHAVCGVGIAQIKGVEYLKFENSYGEQWGDGGYGYIRFKDIRDCYGIIKAPHPFDEEVQSIHFNAKYNTAWVFRGVNFERHDFNIFKKDGKLYCSIDDMFSQILKFKYKELNADSGTYRRYPEIL